MKSAIYLGQEAVELREVSLYRVPESVSDQEACMVEPFTVGMRTARMLWSHTDGTSVKWLRMNLPSMIWKARSGLPEMPVSH